MEQPIAKNPRIEVVDVLRGFAVMAIILVHNLEHFIFRRTIRKGLGKISGTVSYGVWCCWWALPR